MNRQTALVVGGASVLSLAAGSVLGYLFAKKKLGAEFDARLDQELTDAQKHFKTIYKSEPKFESPQTAAEGLLIFDETAAATLKTYQGSDEEPEKVLVPEKPPLLEVHRNIFQEVEIPMRTSYSEDWDAEVRSRNPDRPYVLQVDEYMNNELGYDQVTMTWYKKDAVLVDERDTIIHESEVDYLVGLANLKRFGAWSNDPRVVYVRCPKRDIEFEIVLNDGSYAVDVLGFDPPQLRDRPNPPNKPARERFERGARIGGIPAQSGDNG